MKRFYSLSLLILFTTTVYAQETVRFSSKELDAAFVLMRPELNSIELDGKKGVFEPAPSLKYLGVEREEFIVDLGFIANVADLRFNHLKAKLPQVSFEEGAFRITVPLEDQTKAIQSALGSISLKGVDLVAVLGWKTLTSGQQELVVISTQMKGTLAGSGVLRSSFVLGKTRELLMKVVGNLVRKLLAKEKVQTGLGAGLVTWSRFYSGTEYQSIVPGSLQFFNEGRVGGIQYQVQ